mgnify:CR=1 FL=1
MEDYPLISIVIVTHNSQRTLEKSLQSIAKQNYPKNKVETLIVDGRSTDDTLKITRKYNCKIIDNPKILLIHGKQIGYLMAKGKYMLSLDSDEVLANPNSLKLRIETFQKNPLVHVVMASGLRTPDNYSPINHYINNFGDPFSYFVYRLSHNPDFYIDQLTKIGTIITNDKDCLILSFPPKSSLPIIEPTGAGGIIDLAYCKQHFPKLRHNPDLIIHVFYLLNQKGMFLGVTKKDPIIHYSAGSWRTYLRKISAKVKNNIFQTTMAEGGFFGREKFVVTNLRKYLFIPYSFSIVFPLIESLTFVWTRRNLIFLIHPFLCLYTSAVIIFWFIMKTLGSKPGFINY